MEFVWEERISTDNVLSEFGAKVMNEVTSRNLFIRTN